MKQFYTIKEGRGTLLKNPNTNRIYLLKYPIQAFKIIEKKLGNSKNLRVVNWRTKEVE